jgi:Recombination endonuclease VII
MPTRSEWARRRYAEDPEFRKRKLAANRRHRRAHLAKFNERRRRRWATDPEFRKKQLARRNKWRRKRQLRDYGITLEDYDALLAKQNGVCAICKKKSDRTLCVDHCHSTGVVRGLLCLKCNTGLGCYDDNPSFMLIAIEYLAAARGIADRCENAGLDEHHDL